MQIHYLQLGSEILVTSKSSPAARNRFIYYPDRLVRLPVPGPDASIFSCLKTLFSEPLFDGLLGGLFHEISRPKNPDNVPDESVASFVSRRFSPQIADNIVSAVFHGIYAGDINELSARMVLPQLYTIERLYGSIFEGYWNMYWSNDGLLRIEDNVLLKKLLPVFEDKESRERMWLDIIRSASVYTFKGGMERLVLGLVDALKRNPNVRIKLDTPIGSLKLQPSDRTDSTGRATQV